MAINKLTPVDFNQRIQIGTVKTVQNPINGTSKQTFISQFSLYCAPYTRSIAYSYQLTAEQLEQVVVIIRHNPKVYEGIKCQYKGKLYDVINDSIDDSSNYLSCDYLTLKQVTKGA
ncbi:phage head closure protein [Lactiplantibacillus pentosus]|uniref:Phage head closure protein n=1 Tax=Lactiplantibacillus pentosus TaxID=1589 RepID=A0AAW8W2D7_LACPE|nr:phage head closure protein [Lactiplantibacillus pentosus]MBU7530756.1 phage head closure protein [Lactiplantibacillus pentosus]MDT6991897.1 phage head closure protein [Lactiplantibacillus pentosus]